MSALTEAQKLVDDTNNETVMELIARAVEGGEDFDIKEWFRSIVEKYEGLDPEEVQQHIEDRVTDDGTPQVEYLDGFLTGYTYARQENGHE